MLLIVAKFLIPKGYRGLAIFPFVLVKYPIDKENAVFVNHEKIHLRQQAELLIFPFFIWYLLEYCIRLIQYKNANLAYRNISFEREAYENESNLEYLKNRSFCLFLKYVDLKK
ncbi:hypothetical protein ACNQF7_00265 [Flavobacterium sp. RSP29]|uniref:hypothetical protein n=1 Tax=Flavobacterium sp. RSP29 TaxID=3401731 RepID=UPI003AAF0B81